jgi:hydrogenase nickel incorporation protein HypA/HybF
MHEYSLVQALLDRVKTEAESRNASAVHVIALRLGEAAGVVPELFETAFEMAKTRTVCENARLEVEIVAARWQCPGCHGEIKGGEILSCPTCGVPARLVSGDELLLERLELEVEED